MKKFSLLALLVALGVGTASTLRVDHHNSVLSPKTIARNADGAFRDGLYLGRLAAGAGAESHVAIGRWSTLEDRSSFAAGYQQGYSEILASRSAHSLRGAL